MTIDKTKIPAEVLHALEKLQRSGYKSFIVGGSVRDLLLGKEPQDFDICTSASPAEVKDVFPRVADTGLKFGTVSVLTGRFIIEVTTFRRAVNLKDDHRQQVSEFGESEIEDVMSRDFTINALLFDGEKIIDHVEGLTDLMRNIIKAVGCPEHRFKEDALRMLRAVRLRCELGFAIYQATMAAMVKNASLIENCAPERIRDELTKILMSSNSAEGIDLMRESGLLQFVLPELQAGYKFNQCHPCHDKDVFHHTLAVLDNTPPDLVVRLAALLHDIAKPVTYTVDEIGCGHFYGHDKEGSKMAREILKRLKFDKKTTESTAILVKEHMHKLRTFSHKAVKRLLKRVGPDRIYKLLDLQLADVYGTAPPHDIEFIYELRKEVQRILAADEPLSVKDLAIDGDDLIRLGVKPGPQMGEILNRLLDKVASRPELNTEKELSSIVSEEIGKEGGWNN